MLTDTALRNLKPKSKIYKVSDRDGMYVAVPVRPVLSLSCRRATTLTLACPRQH